MERITNFWQPIFGCVEVSSLCNYKCKMCSWWKNRKEEWPFSAKEFLKILDSVKEYLITKKLDFTLFGGEPMLWKDLYKFLEGIDKTKFRPVLNTNGNLTGYRIIKE